MLFRLAWLKVEGTGLDGFYSIYQGHLFFQKDTYGYSPWSQGFGPWSRSGSRSSQPRHCLGLSDFPPGSPKAEGTLQKTRAKGHCDFLFGVVSTLVRRWNGPQNEWRIIVRRYTHTGALENLAGKDWLPSCPLFPSWPLDRVAFTMSAPVQRIQLRRSLPSEQLTGTTLRFDSRRHPMHKARTGLHAAIRPQISREGVPSGPKRISCHSRCYWFQNIRGVAAHIDMAVGQNQWPFWGRCTTHFRTYFSGWSSLGVWDSSR